MIIVPEIETVVILTPRTGSRSLKNAVLHRYPQAMLLYRHMEADGIPAGYDQWRKVGVVRDPVERLFSLFNFLHNIGDAWAPEYEAYVEKMRASVKDRDFSDWVINNEVVFTDPYSSDGPKFWPQYNVRHRLPENRKSQWTTLRPDLGTELYQFQSLDFLMRALDLPSMEKLNETYRSNREASEHAYALLSEKAMQHMQRYHEWDMAAAYPCSWRGPRPALEVTSKAFGR